MKVYDGAMLHGTNKQKITPEELGEVVSLDLGAIPEEVINEEISPMVKELSDVLAKYQVYLWLSIGHHED